MSEQESVSERELASYLTEELFSGQPRSVGEALAAADEEEPTPEPPAEEPPIVVTDEPVQPEPPAPEAPTEEPSEEEAEEGEEEEGVEAEAEDENIVWAQKKYGEDTAKWAKAARDQEQHISRLANQLKEAQDLAGQWYEYAQEVEQQAQQTQRASLPLSSAEENWVEQSLADPLGHARQAAFNGNFPLYNAVISRVAEENPMLAAQIGTQVQMDLQAAANAEARNGEPQTLDQALGASFGRLGIDLRESGPAMSEMLAELGEHHPYVQALLTGDDGQRDLAVQAVFDLVRASSMTTRRVRDEARAGQIKREAELRKQAAGVVTGAPHTPPPEEDPFMAAMEQEWRDRRQWGDE